MKSRSGNKANWGGKRENAGAKPKEVSLTRIEHMKKIRGDVSMYELLFKWAKSSDPSVALPAIKVWLSYEEGSPTQTINQTTTGGLLITYETDEADNTFNETASGPTGDRK